MAFEVIWSTVSHYGPYIMLLVIFAVFVAYKLRLMKKVGFYIAGMGAFFFIIGIATLGNPILLLIGNVLFMAGKYYLMFAID